MLRIFEQELGGPPIVRVEILGTLDVEASEMFFMEMEARSEQNRPQVWVIFDSTQSKMPSMPVIKRWSEWVDESRELTQRNCYGIVHVIPSAAVRGVLKFINKLAAPAVETHVVRDAAAADAIVCERLIAEGLMSPEERRDYLGRAVG